MSEKVKKSKKLVVAAAAVLACAIAIAAYLFLRGIPSSEGVQVVQVEQGDIEESILATGTVKPENRLEIKSPIAGRIEAVYVDEGQEVKKGKELVLMSSTERAALLDAARVRGSQELAKWEEYYKPAKILAPIDGTIILRSIEPGQSFTSADPLLVMSDRLTVKTQVDETDIARIQLKQIATVTLDAYSKDPIPSKVDQIAFDATTVSNVTTYIVDVLPDSTPEFMRSGMTANVRFLGAAKKDILLLPSNAVRNKDGKHYVLLEPATRGDPALEREVETGITDGKRVEITAGLSLGDRVLIGKVTSTKPNGTASQKSPLTPFGPGRRR